MHPLSPTQRQSALAVFADPEFVFNGRHLRVPDFIDREDAPEIGADHAGLENGTHLAHGDARAPRKAFGDGNRITLPEAVTLNPLLGMSTSPTHRWKR